MDMGYEEAGEAAEVVEEGEMPLWDYALLHPAANLSKAEQVELVKGLAVTLGAEVETGGDAALAEGEGHGDRDEEDER